MQASKQADIHTHASCNTVPLVWGLLRLAPIISTIVSFTYSTIIFQVDLSFILSKMPYSVNMPIASCPV